MKKEDTGSVTKETRRGQHAQILVILRQSHNLVTKVLVLRTVSGLLGRNGKHVIETLEQETK